MTSLTPQPADAPAAAAPDLNAPWWQYAQRVAVRQAALDVGQEPEQGQLDVEVVRRRLLRKPHGRGRMENNLSRKAVFRLQPRDGAGEYETTDVVGKTTLTYALGQLGPLEMDLVTWLSGQWSPDNEYVEFSYRSVARAFGRSWKGEIADDIKRALMNIFNTEIRGRMWDAETRRHATIQTRIIETLIGVEERETEHGPAVRPGAVAVKLASWLQKQLIAGQYSDFDFALYKGRLRNAHARRLFLFLEGQDGDDEGTHYRVRIDETLGNSLGTDAARRNPSRFRQDLARYGREICDAHPHYEQICIRAGDRRAEYYLCVTRSRAWMMDKRLARRGGLRKIA